MTVLIAVMSLAVLYLYGAEEVVGLFHNIVGTIRDQRSSTLGLVAAILAAMVSFFYMFIRRADYTVEKTVQDQTDTINQAQVDVDEMSTAMEQAKAHADKAQSDLDAGIASLNHERSDHNRTSQSLIEKERLVDCIQALSELNDRRAGADYPFSSSLQEIMKLTGSTFGFISSVREGEQGHAALQFMAVCSQSTGGAGTCKEQSALQAIPATPLDELLKTVAVNNDLHGDTSLGGAPETHPPLDSIMTIPLLRGQNLIGYLSLANRKDGYSAQYPAFIAPIAAILTEWMDSREAWTARRRVQDSYKRLIRQSDDILTAAHDGVITFNSRGEAFDLNTQAEAMFGVNTGEAKDLTVTDFINMPGLKEDGPKAAEKFFATQDEGAMSRHTNVSALHHDGHRFPVDVVIAAHDSGPHKQYRIYIRNLLSGHTKAQEVLLHAQEEKEWLELQTKNIKQEIVESKKTEQRALAQIEKAERASRTKLELLANMSHELATPINAIVGFSGTLLDGPLADANNQQQREYIQYIIDAGNKLLDYINGVLDLSGVEDGRMEIDPDDALAIGDYAKFSAHVRQDHELVEALFQRALELDPRNPVILSNYSLFRTSIRKDHERAETLYKYALEADPDSALACGGYAVFLSDARKHHDRAEEMFKQAIRLDPEDANNLANYADFLSGIYNYHDRAETYYKKAIEQDPDNTAILGRYAHFLKDVRTDDKQAEAWFARAIETDPEAFSLRLEYAFFLFDINDEKRGIELLGEVIPRLYGEELLMAQLYKYVYARSASNRTDALGSVRDLLESRVRCPLFDPSPLVRRMVDGGHPDARFLEALARVITVRDTLLSLDGYTKWQSIRAAKDIV